MMTTTTECCDICTLNHATEDHASIKPIKIKAFRRADLTDVEKGDINQLWHLSRIEGTNRHVRLSYIFKWFRRRHQTEYSDKALWLAIDEETQLGGDESHEWTREKFKEFSELSRAIARFDAETLVKIVNTGKGD